MYLANYWALLVLLPGAAAIAWSMRRRGYSPGQAAGVIALRAATLAALVLVLADAHVSLKSSQRRDVFLIDVSDSFKPNQDLAEAFVRKQIELIDPSERVTVMAFAGESVVTWRGAGGATPATLIPTEAMRDTGRTDLGGALAAAGNLVGPAENGVIYLISDGLATEPLDRSTLSRLAARGIVCNVVATRAGYAQDIRILSATGPDYVSPGERFNIEAEVFSETATTATLTVEGPGMDAKTAVEVRSGAPTAVTLTAKAPEAGLGEYTVSVSGSPDPVTENDRLKLATLVKARPEILVIGRSGSAAEASARALPGFTVRLETPEAGRTLSLDEARLATTELVVIDNVAAESISAGTMETLRRFVAEGGGGLLMLGGTHSFALGGWASSEVEKVLPVWCDPRDAEKEPMGLMLLLDASGSMSEGTPAKIELAKRAALNAVMELKDKDLVGVVLFRVTPEELVKLRPPAPIDAIRDAILGVNASGGTNMYPAISRAASELAGTDKPLKHILLMSDGKSQPGDASAVIAALVGAKVTLSAVMTGADADRETLTRLAKESGGRFYEVTRMSELAGVFLDDLRRVEGPLERSGKAFPLRTVTPLPFPVAGDAGGAGEVFGYNRVRAKSGSTVIWDTDAGHDKSEPVLVIGRAGLGQSAALMTAPGTQWAPTETSRQVMSMLAPLMKNLAGSGELADYRTDIRAVDSRCVFTVSAEHDGAPINLKHLRLTLQPAQGESRELAMEQTAPGRYSAEAHLNPEETAVAVVSDVDTGRVLNRRAFVTGYPSEYRRFAPDSAGLAELARLTGGRVFDKPSEVAQYLTNPTRDYQSLRWPLMALVLLLFVAEAALRALGRV